MLSEGAAHAATLVTWTGTSGNWGIPTNWDSKQVPNNNGGNLFDAQINSGSSNLDNDYTIQRFLLNGGSLTGAKTLTLNDIFNWSGGTIGPSSTVNANGGLNISNNSSNIFLATGATINNAGTTNWTGTGASIGLDKATFNNQAGATFTAQSGSHQFAVNSGTPVFNNAGTLVNNSGAGKTTSIDAQFNNTGTVTAQSGVLSLTGGGAIGGTFTGDGTVNFNGGTLNFNNPNFTGTGANLTGSNNLSGNFSGLLNWSQGTINGTLGVNANGGLNISNNSSNTILNTGATINNAGTTNWTGTGALLGLDKATFNNQAGATFTAQSGSHQFAVNSGTPVFNNAGTLVNNSGAGTTAIDAQFNNTGTVTAQSGVLSLTGGGAIGGTFTGDGTVNFNGGTSNFNNPNFTGTGANLTGSNNLSGNFSGLLNWSQGTINGTLGVNANGGLNISNNSSNTILNTGATINNAGTTNWTGTGALLGLDKATFNNQAGATFTAQSGSHQFAVNSGTPVFNNAGTFVNNSGSGKTTTIDAQFNNTGTVDAQSGVLALTGTDTIGGTFTGNGTVNFANSTSNFNNPNFTGTGANLTGSNNLSGNFSGLLNWSQGTINGTLGVNANGGLNISNNSSNTILNTGATINNAGTTNWTGTGALLGLDKATFNNLAGATFTAQSGSHQFAVNSGTPVFNNAGTFVNNSGSGKTTTIDAQFNNTGNVRSTTGNLQFTGGYTQTAGSTVLNGGTLQSSNLLAINGGSLSGTGTITSNVNIGNGQGAGATIKAGSSPGQLNVIGNLTLASNATSAFDIAGITQGTEYSFLNVTGSANLNGGLLVNMLNGFNPSSSNIFTVLTASNGISGTFNTNRISTAQGTFDVAYTANSVQLRNFQAGATPVPEPSSTLGILSLGVLGGGSFLKRKLKGRKQAI